MQYQSRLNEAESRYNDLTAKQQPVKVGWNVGEDTVIASGLQPGQRVVTDGQLRLTPGAKVDVKSGL